MRSILGLLAGATALLMATGAGAVNQCKMDAQNAFQDCKDACREQFVAAKLTCKNVDPECGSACLSGRHACRAAVDNILSTGQLPPPPSPTPPATLTDCSGGTNACDAALLLGRQGCWLQYCAQNQTCNSCGDANITDHNACYECVDPFQVIAFSCRDTCRDSFRQNSIVKQDKALCQTSFKSCIAQCPPPPTPTPGS